MSAALILSLYLLTFTNLLTLSYIIFNDVSFPPMILATGENNIHGEVKVKGAVRKRSSALFYQILKRCGLRQKAKPLATCCPFTKLPTEIIQQIASYLPLVSQAAVTLTKKSLLNAIGTWSWKELIIRHQERINFLVLLERDNCGRYWLCRDCAVLHHKEVQLWNCPAYEDTFMHYSESHLNWAYIYLIMQQHYRGMDFGLPIDVLSQHHKFPKPAFDFFFCEMVHHGKIINDEIFIKVKLTIDISLCIEEAYISICNHLSTERYFMMERCEEFQQLLSCRLHHLRLGQKFCAFCTPILRRCKWCAIEYDFPIRSSSKGRKLEIDVWANLGSGQDRSDPKWSLPNSLGFPEDTRLEYELGSIRAKYELGMMIC